MEYRISVPKEGAVQGLDKHVFGLNSVHNVEIINDKGMPCVLYDKKNVGFGSLAVFIEENKGTETGKSLHDLQSGYRNSIEQFLPHYLCMSTSITACLMKELAPNADYEFTYLLYNPIPNSQKSDAALLWHFNFVLEIKPGLSRNFRLDVAGHGVFPIEVKEKLEEKVEKIPEDSSEQREKAAVGAD